MAVVGLSIAAEVRASIKQPTNIPAQSLAPALQSLAKDRNFQIVYVSEEVGDRRTGGAVGEYTPEEALKQLLRGTGLTYKYLDEKTVTIMSQTAASAAPIPRQVRADKGGQKATDSFRLAQGTQTDPVTDASVAGSAGGEQPSQPSQKTADTLEEVIVTANKREESINKVGLTIKALGGAQLEQQHVASLADLAVAVPGLTFTQTDSNTPVYTLRGIGFYDTTLGAYPSVSVYLDQAPLSFPTLTKLTLFDIERVEVLKGPQGTLFGNNATGGAINYIAAKPTRDFKTGISLDEGRFDTFTTDAFISGPLTKNLLGRFAIKVESGNGWQESISRPGDSNGAPETFAARLLFDWRPFEALRVQTNLNAWLDRSQPPAAQFVEFIPNFPAPNQPPLVPNAVDDPRLADWTPYTRPEANNRLTQAAVRADYDVTSSIVLTSLTSYVDYRQRQRPEGDGLAQARIDVIQNDGYIRSINQELRLADSSNPLLRWTIGGNYSHDFSNERDSTNQTDSSSYYTETFAGLPFGGNSFWTSQVMKNYAGFADGTSTLGEFTLKAGVRYTQADRNAVGCNQGWTRGPTNTINEFFTQFLAPAFLGHPLQLANGSCIVFNKTYSQLGAFDGELDQHNVSWRTGLDWNPTDTLLAYFDVAKGYKAGSFPALAGSTDVAYTPVTQESVLTYEGGIKTQLLERRLSLNVSAFHSDYKDKQVKAKLNDPIFGPLDALVNIPKSVIKGIEVETAVHPEIGLTLGASLTYLDAKLVEANGIVDLLNVSGNWSGNPIPYTSKWNASANANYTFPLPWGDTEGFLGAQATYRSVTTSSIGNEPVFQIRSYTLFDAQGGVDFAQGRYRVMLWGKNITNKFYLSNVIHYTDGIQRFMGMPATYGLTVSFKY
jgi:outer membrane receptor protein involved in Fe transport